MEKDVRCCSLWLLMHGNQSWELQHPLCVLNVNVGTAQGTRTPEAGFLRPEFRPLLAENNSQRFLATHSTDLSMSTQSPALWFHCASSLLCCLKDGEPSNWMSLGSQKGSCPSFEGHISRRGSLAQSISLFGIHDGCTITAVGNLVCLLHRAGSLWPGTDGRSPGDLLHFHRSATPGTGKPEEQFAGANKAS